MIEFFSGHHNLIVILHLISAAVGLGAATATDVLFFKFLKDFRISKFEADTMKVLSPVIWTALGLALLSGLGLYLPAADILHAKPKFLVKMLAFIVVIVNGVFLNSYITPRLEKISFGKRHRHQPGELHHIRKIAFASGAVSIISWYSAFILGAFRGLALSFENILFIYLAALALGIAGSQFFERWTAFRAGE